MTASSSSPTAPDPVARVGLDWADRKHDIALREIGSEEVEHRQIPHTPEAIAEWVAELRRRFGGRPVAIALEQSRGGLIHALLPHEFLILYPVNPASFARYRKLFAPSGAKDDPTDAELLLDFLEKHEASLRPWVPDDAKTRALGRLVEARRKAVDLRTKLVQKLTAELKGYFPQALDWTGGHLASRLATDFLLKWPTLAAVQRARPETVRSFYYAHNCRAGERIEERIAQIRAAEPLTTDPGIVEPSVLTVQMLARQLQALEPSIRAYDKEIARLFQEHPDADLFEPLPGAGTALAPRLLAAFGTDRNRYQSALDIQQFSGTAPVTVRSGNRRFVHWRPSAPTFLRQTFHEFAQHSIHQSRWARAYYEQQRERGSRHHAAVRALAFKWQRILFRCWKDRTPYSEDRYLDALRRRGSPLAARLESVA